MAYYSYNNLIRIDVNFSHIQNYSNTASSFLFMLLMSPLYIVSLFLIIVIHDNHTFSFMEEGFIKYKGKENIRN